MSAGLLAALEGRLATTALVWRLDRQDGVVLGFTTHDRNLRHGSLTYRASPGVSVSTIVARASLEDDGITLSGPLRADTIRQADVDDGRWNMASVAVGLADWKSPETAPLALFRGQVTSISLHGGPGGSFEMEARRVLPLRANTGPFRCSPMCRAALGDRRCGVDLDARTLVVRVTEVEQRSVLLSEPVHDGGRFAGGTFRLLSGAGAGFETEIELADGLEVRLGRAVGGWAAGARARATEGCDKRFVTCVERFGNAAAFDGEPHVPGRDWMQHYGAP